VNGKDTTPVAIQILDKEYLVACPIGEQEALQAAGKYLQGKMKEIRDSGKIIGMDRIAVMAALNIAHELLQKGRSVPTESESVGLRIRSLQEKIDVALARAKVLENSF
jgi:Uncharacterized protein conserved in bacteria